MSFRAFRRLPANRLTAADLTNFFGAKQTAALGEHSTRPAQRRRSKRVKGGEFQPDELR